MPEVIWREARGGSRSWRVVPVYHEYPSHIQDYLVRDQDQTISDFEADPEFRLFKKEVSGWRVVPARSM